MRGFQDLMLQVTAPYSHQMQSFMGDIRPRVPAGLQETHQGWLCTESPGSCSVLGKAAPGVFLM